jgi:hypothetical protein
VELAETQITLHDLPIGARLLVRTKKDWRMAAVSRFSEDRAVLTICSPSGRTYRLYRDLDCLVIFEGIFPMLEPDEVENWRDNFSIYDRRW